MDAFIELDHLSKIDGWSIDTLLHILDPIMISFIGTVIFAVLGAIQLYKQSKKINKEGAKSISVQWKIVSLAMFSSFLPYGLELNSLALIIQCLLRVPFYLYLMWQLYQFHKKFTISQWILIALMTLITFLSFFKPTLIATGLLWVSVMFTLHQPWKIAQTESTEGVEVRLLIVYLLSALFWLGYGLSLGDYYIVSWAAGYVFAYGCGIAAYQSYK